MNKKQQREALKAARPKAKSDADSLDAVAVTMPKKTAAEIEAAEERRWEHSQALRKAGKLKPLHIKAIRAHAERKIEDDEDMRWALLADMTDEQIWEVVQWCDYERGAINEIAKRVNQLAADKKSSVPPAPTPEWDATVCFVAAGRALAQTRVPGLRAAIARWAERLADLGGEPVCQDWSRFRPLRLSREEDWSDWLAHLIETSSTGVLAARLLGLTEAKCRGARVEREVPIESSRLDLQICWSDGTYAHIEVKVGDLSLDKTVPTALAHRRLVGPARCDDFLLLPREDCPEWAGVSTANPAVPITVITWHYVASAIRFSLASSVQEPTIWRAWAAAYLGAIHHRLLGHPRIDVNHTGRLGIDMAGVLEILEEAIT